ncbi:MAG: NAD/NADP octopine/nopaline dehydrogenase family protein [Armatimonadota bacterium]|nr:MAG: NAD/NADP octopine/nopaline dehydrogenase family protein [Armatimonadota bacterium]
MTKRGKKRSSTFAVLGAGHGGLAMAGYLALKEFEVRLYNRTPERLEPIRRRGAIELIAHDGEELPRGTGPLALATPDIGEALDGADVIMVVVPATGHAWLAEMMAPYLADGQIVVLNPGRTGGALEVNHIFQQKGVTADVIIAETQTFLYASRAVNPAQVQIFRVKNSVPVAAIPAYRTPEVVNALAEAFSQFIPGDNVIKTGMDNIGAVFHPAVTVLNSARIESTRGGFEYYVEGITPAVASVLEVVDRERVSVGAAIGFNCMTAREWLYVAYDAVGQTLHDAIHANRGYYGIQAPPHLHHRYLTEDVPMSLVPIASIGDLLGSPCPTIKTIVELANIMHGCNYWETGRTAEKLGLAGLDLQSIRRLVLEGKA